MSYTLTPACRCTIDVSCHPRTSVAHTRIIERAGERCPHRRHGVGVRLREDDVPPDAAPIGHAAGERSQPSGALSGTSS